MASWLFGWAKGKDRAKTYLKEGDVGFTHLAEPGPDTGSFAVSEVRERPEQADRGASRITKIPHGQYQDTPQVMLSLQALIQLLTGPEVRYRSQVLRSQPRKQRHRWEGSDRP